ncbi:MAG: NAD-dependent deacylase [Bacteroidetes bacterium]|nr:MAG: NAD-dependent deacylase [Bacteroidota bacterium]TAE64887.1 MAG: NAD-dependent deacylase [Bacteroidota bacterium]TAF98337.1 MAG: NAD-dependent deacylase [Bacteroidota bacterium]
MKKNLVVLTGAGISAESGVQTFRDSNGLWENHAIEDVATPNGWNRNKELVLSFYNARRAQLKQVKPNTAHLCLAEWQKHWNVQIITQNVDDLHERAGSKHVLHLHGELIKKCSSTNKEKYVTVERNDIRLGDLAPDGSQYRPYIVWFGEDVPAMETAVAIAAKADVLLVIGTSLQVYPAASLVHYVSTKCACFVVDNHIPRVPDFFTPIEMPATKGLPFLYEEYLNKLL